MAFTYKGTGIADIMGSGTATPGSGLTSGLAGVDRWDASAGGDTFVYELANMGGNDRFSGGSGVDTVEFRLTGAEWTSFQVLLTNFANGVATKAASYVSGELPFGVVNGTPLVFSPTKSLTVLEAENVRVYADNVLVLGAAPPTTVGTVVEAGVGLTPTYTPTPGTPQAQGFMPSTDGLGNPIPPGSTWSVVGVNAGVGLSPDIFSTGGAGFSITPTGQWTYNLDNNDVDTQDLKNGETRVMSFKVAATDPITNSAVFNNVTITLKGTNDAQTIAVTGTDFAVQERGGVANGTVGVPDGDGASGKFALTNVDNTPVLDLAGSFEQLGTATIKGTYGDLVVTRTGAQATAVLGDDLTNATWSYTLRNGDANVEALFGGQKVVDVITLPATKFDGASNVITINITGADDAPVISNTTTDGDVIEDGGIQNGILGDPDATGTFSLVDPDVPDGPLTLTVFSSTSVYGDFTLVGNTWTYILDNTRPATQALTSDWTGKVENFKTESLTVASTADPAAKFTVTVNVFGRDDLTQAITNAYDIVNGPSVNETADVTDKTAGGVLTRIDVDGEHLDFSPFGPVAPVPGSPIIIIGGTPPVGPNSVQTFKGQYGDFTLIGDDDGAEPGGPGLAGTWTYTRNDSGAPNYLNSAALIKGQFATDVMLVRSADNGAQTAVSVTIIGQDDPATFSGSNTGAVVEAGGPLTNTLPGTPVAKGTLTVLDDDAGQSSWGSVVTPLAGKYGDFTFNLATGAWSYTLNNIDPDTEVLTAGQKVSEQLKLTSFDGTSATITVDITGTNDHAKITVTPTPDLSTKEAGGVANGTLNDPDASGDLNVADIDGVAPVPINESFFKAPSVENLANYAAVLTDQAGVYGNFSFDPNTGTWTYQLNNFAAAASTTLLSSGLAGIAQAVALQALAEGQSVTDSMLVYSHDGSASELITVNIVGSLDVTAISNTPSGAGSSVKAEGTFRPTPTTAALVVADYTAGGNLNPIAPATVDTYNPPALAQLQGVYGKFTFIDGPAGPTSGQWTYTLDNEDPDTLALVSKVDGSGNHIPSAQDFLTVSNQAAVPEVFTIAVDVFGAYTRVDLKGIALDTQPDNTIAPFGGAPAEVLGTNGQGSITFIARNGDPSETLTLHAGNPIPTPAPWGTVTVNDGTLTTVTMPNDPATNVPGVINAILHVWDGDTVAGALSPALNLGVSIAQGTIGDDTIVMIGNGGMASGYDGNDNITGTVFKDFIDGGINDDTLTGGSGNDTIVGGDGDDDIDGGINDDVLWGGDGKDFLDGGDGADVLFSGAGKDTMNGGIGTDTFYFASGPFGSPNDNDLIQDYTPADDTLRFDNTLLTTTGYQVAALPAATSIASGNWFNTTNTAGILGQTYQADDRFIYDTTTGGLYYDADGGSGGAGLPLLVATLTGIPVLNATEFSFTAPPGP